jgi:hypothetical protein
MAAEGDSITTIFNWTIRDLLALAGVALYGAYRKNRFYVR